MVLGFRTLAKKPVRSAARSDSGTCLPAAATPPALARSNLKFQEDSARILELKDAQDEWAKTQASGAPDLAEREQTLTDLADELDVPHDHVLTGAPMTDSTYQDLFDQLNNRQRALGQQLTRDALNYMPEFVEP